MSAQGLSKRFWNEAARENAAWYIATGFSTQSPEFFRSGTAETDAYLRLGGLSLGADSTVLEVGCGTGRMTQRLADLAGTVVATDVSIEMLDRARRNLAAKDNVRYLEVSGEGELPIESESVDAVFSYITMQHVPSARAQERYFAEALRVIRPGGWVFMQFRRSSLTARVLDWVGHAVHLMRGRKTLNRAWRGARVSESALRAHASDAVAVELIRAGRRHVWVRAIKTA